MRNYAALLSIVLGICDALACTLPHTSGDKYVLALFAISISPSWKVRAVSIVCFMYIVGTVHFPHVYGALRMLAALSGLACCHVYFSRKQTVIRTLVSFGVVFLTSASQCDTLWRALPFAHLLYISLYVLKANPCLTFIIASLIS